MFKIRHQIVFVKAEVSPASNNDVIDNANIYGAGSFGYATRETFVFRRW